MKLSSINKLYFVGSKMKIEEQRQESYYADLRFKTLDNKISSIDDTTIIKSRIYHLIKDSMIILQRIPTRDTLGMEGIIQW